MDPIQVKNLVIANLTNEASQLEQENRRLRVLEQRWRSEYDEAMKQLRQRSDECDTLREFERLWYDRYYTLFVSCKEAKDSSIFVDWARQVNDKYREKK